jgi:hypothetical protein
MFEWKNQLRIMLAIAVLVGGYLFVPGPRPLAAEGCTTLICTDIRCVMSAGGNPYHGYLIDNYPP